VDKRQPPPRRRMLKSGKILLGKHPVPCTVRNLSETGACLQVQTTAGIPQISPLEHARSSGVTKPSSGSSLFNGNSGKQMRDDRSHALILYMFAAVAGLSFLAAVYFVAWAYR
jgi:hypothetical protein